MLGRRLATEDLYKRFKDAVAEDRPALLADVLAGSRDSFRCIVNAAATRSIDEAAFYEGVLTTLREDAGNLPALRLLAWHQNRNGAFEDAKRTLRQMIAQWPNVPDLRQELARVSMMAPGPDGDEIMQIAVVGLHTPLALASYRCQFALAQGQALPEGDAGALQLMVEAARTEIFGAGEDLVLPAQSHGVFFEVLQRISVAKSIALVANGPSLTGAKRGDEIDAHELVIRCNFPEFTKFSEDVGNKVDIVFFSEALVRGVAGLVAREPAYADCFALAFHPEASAVFDGNVYAQNMSARVSRIHPTLRDFYRRFFYTRPTTGLMGIVLISVIMGKDLSVYGFDFYGQPTTHYFPSSAPVFLGHELQYERWFLTTFLACLNSRADCDANGGERGDDKAAARRN